MKKSMIDLNRKVKVPHFRALSNIRLCADLNINYFY